MEKEKDRTVFWVILTVFCLVSGIISFVLGLVFLAGQLSTLGLIFLGLTALFLISGAVFVRIGRKDIKVTYFK